MNYTELFVFIVYFVFMLGIGLYFFFKSKGAGEKDYFLGGRKMGAWVSALSAGASDMSAWVLMGLPASIYSFGMGQTWIAIGLAAILILLYVKLVVHRPWPNRRQPGFQVILNGFQQMTMQGEMQSPFNRTGRAPCKLGVLAKQFEIQDGGAGNAVFNRVQLWPTTG